MLGETHRLLEGLVRQQYLLIPAEARVDRDVPHGTKVPDSRGVSRLGLSEPVYVVRSQFASHDLATEGFKNESEVGGCTMLTRNVPGRMASVHCGGFLCRVPEFTSNGAGKCGIRGWWRRRASLNIVHWTKPLHYPAVHTLGQCRIQRTSAHRSFRKTISRDPFVVSRNSRVARGAIGLGALTLTESNGFGYSANTSPPI